MSRPKARDQKLGFRNQGVELTTEDRSPEPSLIHTRPSETMSCPAAREGDSCTHSKGSSWSGGGGMQA